MIDGGGRITTMWAGRLRQQSVEWQNVRHASSFKLQAPDAKQAAVLI
jgi:hypothetical protein